MIFVDDRRNMERIVSDGGQVWLPSQVTTSPDKTDSRLVAQDCLTKLIASDGPMVRPQGTAYRKDDFALCPDEALGKPERPVGVLKNCSHRDRAVDGTGKAKRAADGGASAYQGVAYRVIGEG